MTMRLTRAPFSFLCLRLWLRGTMISLVVFYLLVYVYVRVQFYCWLQLYLVYTQLHRK